MKRLISALLVLLATASVCLGQYTVTKVSEFQPVAAAQTSDLILLSRPGVANYKFTFGALANQISQAIGQPVSYVTVVQSNQYFYSTNVYENDSYVSNYFTTNVFNDTYVSNYFATNQYLITTNLTVDQYVTNVDVYAYYYTTNLITDTYVSNFFNTNIFVNDTYVSNYYTTNMVTWNSNYTSITTNLYYNTNNYFTNMTVSKLYVTEVYNNTSVITNNQFMVTNVWAGPSNTLPLNLGDLNYIAMTPCAVTGVTAKSNTVAGSTLLTILNSSGSNITLYLDASIRSGDYLRSYTISNNAVGMLSLKYSPALGGMTNAVFRMFN